MVDMVAKKKKPREADVIECPYCAHPELFETPSPPPISKTDEMISLKGKYWRKVVTRQKDGASKTWRIKTLPALVYKTSFTLPVNQKQWRFQIDGKKDFIERFKEFTVEVIGLELKGIPLMSAGPGFHRSGFGYHREGDVMVPNDTIISFNACRIAHEKSGITVDAHAWLTHRLLLTFRNLPLVPTKTSNLIAQEVLELFTVETRGGPKIVEIDLVKAIQRLGKEATQVAVAKDLGVTPQALRAWASRFNLKNWERVVSRYSRTEFW